MNPIKKTIILLFIFISCSVIHAQEGNYIFNTRQLTVADGLSDNNILSLYQAHDGIIWIGTKYGLNRYDGHDFKWYTNERNGLKQDFINKIVEDEDHRLWLISTVKLSADIQSKDLTIFDPVTEKSLNFEEAFSEASVVDNSIKNVFQLPDHRLIISHNDGSYHLYSKEGGFVKLPFKNNFKWLGCFENDRIWGSFGNDIVCLNLKGDILISVPLALEEEVFKIDRDPEGNIWLLSGIVKMPNFEDLKVQILSNGELNTILEDLEINNPNRFRMLPNPIHRSMFVVSSNLILEVNKDLQISFQKDFYDPFEIKYFNQFIIDREGTIWNGERNGIQLINYTRSKFKTYLKSDEFTPTRGIIEYGNTIVVNSPRGIFGINKNTGIIDLYSDDPIFNKMKAFPLLVTENNQLWVANNGLHQLDSNGAIIQSHVPKSNKEGKIWSFIKSKSGTWWLGKHPQILYYNPTEHDDFQELTQLNGFNELKQVRVWDFWEDEYGIWIATIKGLFLLDEKKGVIAKYGSDQPERFFLPANQFTNIWKEKKNTYWLTTDDGGLIKMIFKGLDKPPFVQRKTRATGLPTNELYSIFQDDFGKLWISSSNGIIQMDKERMEVENVYYEEQGIAHNECNKLSYFQSTTGQIYFGGLNGVTSFHPKDFVELPKYDVPLIFSDIRISSDDGSRVVMEKFLQKERIKFNPEDKYIVIKLSLQDFFYSDKIKYSYQIQDVDKVPSVFNGNSIQLSNLPYGTHSIEFRGIGPNEQISTQVIVLYVQVVRPFYLRWWFLSLLILLLGLCIWQYSSWRVQSLEKRQIILEKIVNKRTEKIYADKKIIEAQAEQLVELDQVKSRFFENISHELRIPLTLISGPVQSILSRNRLDNRDFTLMKLIQQNTITLLKHVNELLDLSALDADKMELKNEPLKLYAFAKRVINSFEGAAHLKEVSVQLKFDLSPNIQILADEDKLEKILYNYLSNSLKFTFKNGNIELHFYQKNNMLHISTRDTGIGIQEEDLGKIFHRFYQSQEDSSKALNTQGSGIGLGICKEMAKLMGGDVWATSEIGVGSTFYLKIPMIETFETAPTLTPISKCRVNLPYEDKGITIQKPLSKILVVEDNYNLVSFIKIVLEGYEVISAENGKVALDILQKQSFELIISDIMMPEMDGVELIEHLKSNNNYRHIPIIMLTAKQKLEDKVTALRIGVDDYMIKPFEPEELLARVNNLITNNRNKVDSRTDGNENNASQVVTEADIKWLKDVEEYILNKVGEPNLTIKELSSTFAFGIRRFQQKIKSITGLSPIKYLREVKMEYARRLLESGTCHSVSEVSYSIGFSDQHYFSKLYSERYGRTPSSYF
jgi:signal transduction histidine kinase/DNA-binding response OmpR family regulator/ligand-binding sensor domain-containing protein